MVEQTPKHMSEQTLKQVLPETATQKQAKTEQLLSSPSPSPTNPLNSPSTPTTSTSTRDAQTVDGQPLLRPDEIACGLCRLVGRHAPDCLHTLAAQVDPSSHAEPQQPSEEWTGRASGHARSACSPLMPIGARCRSAQFWDQLVKVVCQGPAWSAWCAFSALDERGPCDEVMIDFLTKVLADA